MKPQTTTIKEYIDLLPDDRKKMIKKVRTIIKKNLPTGYKEVMNWGMITYEIPLKIYPDTYNKKPLMYAALANNKNNISVHLCGLYCVPSLKKKFDTEMKKQEKKIDMGKSCLRFKKMEDIPLGVIGEIVSSLSVDDYISVFQKKYKKK